MKKKVKFLMAQLKLARIRKFGRFLFYIISSRKVWRKPRSSRVLIYDAPHQKFLLEYLSPWNPEILYLRGEQINVTTFFKSFLLTGNRRNSYIDAYINQVSPQLIVTTIQNSSDFYKIGKRHPNVRTLFIQNGVQSYHGDVIEILETQKLPRHELGVDIMMTFGASSGALFSRYIEGSIVPIGSLKNNLAPKRNSTIPGTIAFISQYRNTKGFSLNGKFFSQDEYFTQPHGLVLRTLSRYADQHGKKLTIITSSRMDDTDNLEKEKQHFARILGQPCNFSKKDGDYAGYDATDSAEVVVTVESALGYESVARGNKTAIFSFRTELLGIDGLTFGWPEKYPNEGSFWTNRPDPDAFERILDHLFEIDEEQWHAELVKWKYEDIMAYDPGNTILQSVLDQELK